MQFLRNLGKNTFSSLSVRNYRLYFIGQAISLIGTWMQTIAQGLLVLQITHSGVQLGIITALQFVPILFFSPVAGIAADKFSKRNILYFTQGLAGILALILGIIVFLGLTKIWMIYILATLLGLVNTFDTITRQTFVMDLVGKEKLPNAVSLNSSEVNLARVIGPLIAGVLILTIGIAACFIINGISYIAVLVVLALMKSNEFYGKVIGPKIKNNLKAGFMYVKSTPLLANSLIMMAIIGTLSYEFTVTLAIFSQFTFHGNAGTYSLFTAAMGIGSVIGGLYAANLKAKKINVNKIVLAALLFGISIILAAISPTLIIALILMIFVGIFSIYYMSLTNTTLQLESKPEMRGQVMALWSIAFLGSTAVGGPIIGWISQILGGRAGLATGGIAAIIAAGIGAMLIKKDLVNSTTISANGIENTLNIEVEKESRIL